MRKEKKGREGVPRWIVRGLGYGMTCETILHTSHTTHTHTHTTFMHMYTCIWCHTHTHTHTHTHMALHTHTCVYIPTNMQNKSLVII